MNSRRLITIVLSLVLVLAMAVTSCQPKVENADTSKPDDTKTTETKKEEPKTEESNTEMNVSSFEDIVFPDSLPKQPIIAEEGMYDYSYDDMSEKFKVEIFTHNYGTATLPSEEDPTVIWLNDKFNLDITFTTVPGADAEQVLNTRFAGLDEPDVMYLPNRDLAFVLSDQGLLYDAKEIYPYMPHTQNYVTKTMIKWSENSNGELPFITKYGIQDGVWGYAARQDWLDTFCMDMPTTKEEVLAYAKAATFNDPDGNGEADTYFMLGAGNGTSWGMLGGFLPMFGNNQSHVKDGELQHQYFNGVYKDYLMFINELYNEGVLAPDWFTIEWEAAKQYTLNDKIGMVHYPAGALYVEYTGAQENSMESLDVWTFAKDPLIKGGKWDAAGNPGYMFGFSKQKFEDNAKLKRVAHMLDTMVYGGENYFHTIQGGTEEIYKFAGIDNITDGTKEYVYTDTNFFYIDQDRSVFPWGNEDGYLMAVAPWQVFGLAVSWQLEAPSDDPFRGPYAEKANTYSQYISGYDRWEPTGLLVALTGEAAESNTTMTEWVMAEEYKFATGERPFSEWDDFTQEWLDKGGKAIIAQTAESLGAPIPDYAN